MACFDLPGLHDAAIAGERLESLLDTHLTQHDLAAIALSPSAGTQAPNDPLLHLLYLDATGRWSSGQHILLLHSGEVPAIFACSRKLGAHLYKRGVEHVFCCSQELKK
jgi:hypothetical protein